MLGCKAYICKSRPVSYSIREVDEGYFLITEYGGFSTETLYASYDDAQNAWIHIASQ